MKMHAHSLIKLVNIIMADLNNDDRRWMVNNEYLFEGTDMKCLKYDTNFHCLINMAAITTEPPVHNPIYTNTIEMAERDLRPYSPHQGPMGRINIWNIPGGELAKNHRDLQKYFDCIYRMCLVLQCNDKCSIKIDGRAIPFNVGTLFHFDGYNEYHEVVNNGDTDFILLTVDFWKEAVLKEILETLDIEWYINNPERYKPYENTKSLSQYKYKIWIEKFHLPQYKPTS